MVDVVRCRSTFQVMAQHQNFSLKLPSRFQTVAYDAD
jgi:hypothetical protein